MKGFQRYTAAALACVLSFLTAASSADAAVPVDAADEQSLNYAEIVINTVNDIRVSYGLSELATTPLLIDVTDARAEELAVNFDHYRPDGSACFTALKEAGITYSYSAENIAAGRSDPVSTVNQWMQSEGHRANILGEAYTHIGVGYYYDQDTDYVHYWGMFLIGVYEGMEPHIYEDQYIPTRELGDVNGTKSINASDATVILQYSASTAAGLNYPVARSFSSAADVNNDGNINSIDAGIILSYSAAYGSGADVVLDDFIW